MESSGVVEFDALGKPLGGDMRRRNFIGDYRAFLLDELGRSPRTVDSYVWALGKLSEVSGKAVHKLTADDLRAFKRTPYKAMTKSLAVSALHSFHSWGALEGYWKLNGIMQVGHPKQPHSDPAHLSVHSVRALLSACRSSNEHRVIWLGLYAGLRISESATIDESRWVKDRLMVLGKGNKERQVPLHPRLASMRSEILRESPAGPGTLQKALRAVRNRVDVRDDHAEKVRSHTLRKSFGQALYDLGAPDSVVKKVMGHCEDITFRYYVSVPFDKMNEWVSQVDYYSGDPVQLELFA